MRPWTRRSLWSQPRLRRFARSLRAISSLAPSARWRRISIAGEFAASRGGCRTAGPSAEGALAWGRSPICSRTASISARWSTGARSMAANRRRLWIVPCSRRGRPNLWPQAARRRAGRGGRPRPLAGALFDNLATPRCPPPPTTGGAPTRYYVSQGGLQNRPPTSGLVSRVPAAEIEALVVAALRSHLSASSAGEQLPDNDRDLLERHLERVTLTPNHLELRLRQIIEPQAHDPANTSAGRPTA